MEAAKAQAWQRFYDRVVSDKSLPRDLWLASIEDALTAALSDGSRLVERYRAKVAELTQLEQAASRSQRDEQRIADLEGQIGRLIDVADETVRQRAASAGAGARWGLGRALAAVGFATLLFGVGWAGASLYYDSRLATEVARQLQPYVEDLQQTLGKVQADRAARPNAANPLDPEGGALAQAAGASAPALDGRLADHVVQSLGSLRQRADDLGQGFDQVGKTLAALQGQVPDLGQGIDGLAAQIAAAEAALERTAGRAAVVEADPAAGNQQRQPGEGDGAPGAEVVLLKDEVEQSRRSLQQLKALLDENLERAKLSSITLGTALRDARAAERQAGTLVGQVRSQVDTTERAIQATIGQALTGVAQQAEQAVQRDQEAVQRAEPGETTDNVDP